MKTQYNVGDHLLINYVVKRINISEDGINYILECANPHCTPTSNSRRLILKWDVILDEEETEVQK